MFPIPKFPLGRCVATPAALSLLATNAVSTGSLLDRHITGDWGKLCDEDKQANDDAVKHGGQVLSSYELPSGDKVWVITEWDRSVTTVLTPDDY